MAAAFAAGIISFLSPCVLPLVPGYVSYIAGQSIGSVSAPRTPSLRFQTIALSLCFVLGFSTIFLILGASASALGQLLLAHRYELNIAGGVIVIGFGLFTLGLLRPWWLMRDLRMQALPPRRRPIAAYVLGMAFAFGWSPCIGPILGAILTVGAAAATLDKGVALLATYSLGLGVPFLLVGLFVSRAAKAIKSAGPYLEWLNVIFGIILIILGILVFTGTLPLVANFGPLNDLLLK